MINDETRTRTFSHVHVHWTRRNIRNIKKESVHLETYTYQVYRERISNFQRWSSSIRQMNKVFEHFVTEQLSNRQIHIIIYTHVIVIILLLLFYNIYMKLRQFENGSLTKSTAASRCITFISYYCILVLPTFHLPKLD